MISRFNRSRYFEIGLEFKEAIYKLNNNFLVIKDDEHHSLARIARSAEKEDSVAESDEQKHNHCGSLSVSGCFC